MTKMCYNTELGETIKRSMVFRADFINPTSPLHQFLVHSYYCHFILFYFIFMQNISLINRSCFQYTFSVLHKRPAGLPFAILHLQIIFCTWFAGMVMIYHYSILHIPRSLVHYLLPTNQKLNQVVHNLHCTKT